MLAGFLGEAPSLVLAQGVRRVRTQLSSDFGKYWLLITDQLGVHDVNRVMYYLNLEQVDTHGRGFSIVGRLIDRIKRGVPSILRMVKGDD